MKSSFLKLWQYLQKHILCINTAPRRQWNHNQTQRLREIARELMISDRRLFEKVRALSRDGMSIDQALSQLKYSHLKKMI